MSNFTLNTNVIVTAIRTYYPATIEDIEKNKRYNYICLFGIRIDTCDTGKADDVIGCIWMNALGIWSSLICAASTDPSPYYVENPQPAAAKVGGTAWIKEGQYAFYLSTYRGASAFKPLKPVPVYRMPAGQGLDLSNAIESTALDTFIHRSWGSVVFKKDSAGCNILKNTQDLERIAKMAREHIKKYGINVFSYTLLSKQMVDTVMAQISPYSQPSLIVFENALLNGFTNETKFQFR